ncbi:MAG TPA: hypothetical protein VML75_09430 [Kofleriaceae bacterium]|nr:hypothetical protein [Kofleriaceae bacterium]
MKRKGLVATVGLDHLLLLAAMVELSLYRLAAKTLRPVGEATPASWLTVLEYVGLFFRYFTSTLALGLLGVLSYRMVRGRPQRGLAAVPGYLTAILCVGLIGLSAAAVGGISGRTLTLLLEGCFTLTLLAIVIDQITSPGDVAAKLGVVVLATPLIIHYYPSFAMNVLGQDEVVWNDLPLEIAEYGKWSVVLAALLAPYCFAPRPFLASASRLPPLAIATFVGVVGAVILREHYQVGMELAARGMGVDIGPGAPGKHIALYVVALGAITWTLVSALSAAAPARRRIGLGIALVIAGGYSFAWPFLYLLSAVGLLIIGESARHVATQEDEIGPPTPARSFRPPPIPTPVWQHYVGALLEAVREAHPEARPQTMTVRDGDAVASTHIVATPSGVSLRVRIDRVQNSILCIDVLCGREPEHGVAPAWTLYARPERLLGIRAHDEPPASDGAVTRADDAPFDARFRVRDRGGHSTRLLDDGQRARAAALIDGWMAYWPDRALQYRVYPGRGAPLDHPIPITELAFRGENAGLGVDRLVTLLELVIEMAVAADLTRARIGSTAEMVAVSWGLEPDADEPAEAAIAGGEPESR